jgi:putative methionine-R-sulfoxide reductase with GAF domain
MAEVRSPLQGAELWVPKDDLLVLRSGAYGPHTEFARVSGRSRFRRGEGLPGTVWASERTQVWQDLGSHFVRAEHAATAGIDAAIGFPWFVGRELAGVVTLLFTLRTDTPACVELWNHGGDIDVLKHGGGLYVNAAELEAVSGLLQFPYGAGLPGLAWSAGMPLVIDDVRASHEFVRAEPAARAGLRRAIAIPIFRERKVVHVLTLFGSELEAFPRGFELFVPGDLGLVTRARAPELAVPAAVAGGRPKPRPNELLAQDARHSRLPVIAAPTPGETGSLAPEASIVLVLPVHDGARLRGIASLEF